MALEAGTKLGHYEVLSSLGAGGMGEVYRARDTKLGREVAIKLLLEEVSSDPERVTSVRLSRGFPRPDSRWIAYTVRTVRASVFVQPVPATGVRYQINEGAIGHHPFWNPRGGEIFYFGRGGSELVSAPITLTPSLSVGRAEMVPGDHPSGTSVLAPLHYDVLGDGQSFVRTQPVGGVEATAGIDVSGAGLRVVLNWFEELKRLVPTE